MLAKRAQYLGWDIVFRDSECKRIRDNLVWICDKDYESVFMLSHLVFEHCDEVQQKQQFHLKSPLLRITALPVRVFGASKKKQQTGSKQEKEYIKAVYCHSAYLSDMQSTL